MFKAGLAFTLSVPWRFRFVPFVFIGVASDPLVFQKEALHRGTVAKVF
jgi:hypothetical protein